MRLAVLGDEFLSGPDNAVTAEEDKHSVVTRSKDNRILGGALTAANAVTDPVDCLHQDLLHLLLTATRNAFRYEQWNAKEAELLAATW